MMKGNSVFITEMDELSTMLNRAKDFFDVKVKLPLNPFKDELNSFAFADFDFILYENAANAIGLITDVTLQDSVMVISLEPDFRLQSNASFLGALRIASADLKNRYIEMIGADSDGSGTSWSENSIWMHGERVIVFDDSGQWCFFADRDLDITIIATKGPSILRMLRSHRIPLSFSVHKIPDLSLTEKQRRIHNLIATNYAETF